MLLLFGQTCPNKVLNEGSDYIKIDKLPKACENFLYLLLPIVLVPHYIIESNGIAVSYRLYLILIDLLILIIAIKLYRSYCLVSLGEILTLTKIRKSCYSIKMQSGAWKHYKCNRASNVLNKIKCETDNTLIELQKDERVKLVSTKTWLIKPYQIKMELEIPPTDEKEYCLILAIPKAMITIYSRFRYRRNGRKKQPNNCENKKRNVSLWKWYWYEWNMEQIRASKVNME